MKTCKSEGHAFLVQVGNLKVCSRCKQTELEVLRFENSQLEFELSARRAEHAALKDEWIPIKDKSDIPEECQAILDMLEENSRKRYEEAINTCRKLANDEEVSDGELLDAHFALASRVQIGNPLLPISSELFKRYMRRIGMDKTPNGIELQWLEEAKVEEFTD